MNKYQCPQCGAASSMKVSATEYHCIYCDSTFGVKPSKEELLSGLTQKNRTPNDISAQRLALLNSVGGEMQKAAKRTSRIIVLVTFSMVFLIGGIVLFNVKNAFKGSGLGMLGENWSTATVRNFELFSGSKGAVIWQLYEQSGYSLDSEQYTLKIIDPVKKTTLKEFQFVPTVTWSEGFNSEKFIGNFFGFGDTCWIISEENGLTARDIYTGNIIIDSKKLGTLFPQLSKGISKASHNSGDSYFELSTNDGYEYVYCPSIRKLYKKEDWDKTDHDKSTLVNRVFFNLSDDKRPQLFVSHELSSPYDHSSHLFSSDFDNYRPGSVRRHNVESIEQLTPDNVYFNGIVLWANNEQALVAYQEANNKKAAMHISCVNAAGKQVWDISGKTLQGFSSSFADNKRAMDILAHGNDVIVYMKYGDNNAFQVNAKTGKIAWQYSIAK